MNGAQTFIEFPINRLFLESRILAANQFAWFFDWGMYLFLLAALGVVAWIFIDSSQKRKADKALAPRIVALVGTFMVLPAFIFKFTQNADGQVIVLKLLGEPDPTQQIFTEPVRWNVQWLIGGYGPMIAIVGLVGLGIVILAGILYSTTVSRSRPDTAFVSALNNQFGELRQDIASVKARPTGATSAETVSPGFGMGSAGTVGASGGGRRQPAQTMVGSASAGSGGKATIIGSASPTFAELRVVSGGRVGQRWELPAGDAKLGRDEGALVYVDDGRASRDHAKIRFANGAYTIIDLGSSNGTLVNDQKIEGSVPLSDGDSVTIGDTVMVFKSVSRT